MQEVNIDPKLLTQKRLCRRCLYFGFPVEAGIPNKIKDYHNKIRTIACSKCDGRIFYYPIN